IATSIRLTFSLLPASAARPHAHLSRRGFRLTRERPIAPAKTEVLRGFGAEPSRIATGGSGSPPPGERRPQSKAPSAGYVAGVRLRRGKILIDSYVGPPPAACWERLAALGDAIRAVGGGLIVHEMAVPEPYETAPPTVRRRRIGSRW